MSNADDDVIAEWRSRRSFAPVRGDDGEGGIVGWANRLDERAGLITPRESHVPMRTRELWREMFRWPVIIATVLWIAVSVATSFVPWSGLAFPVVIGAPVMLWARSRVRGRKIAEMREELSQGVEQPEN